MKKRLLAFTLILTGSIALSLYTSDGNLYSESAGAPTNGSCTGCHGGSDQTDASMMLTVTDTLSVPLKFAAGVTVVPEKV